MPITELADADGHIIEPGDLWVERLPRDLRDMAPRFYRDEEGRFHQRIYGIDIENLEVMYGGIRPSDMLQSMGLACAMGMPLERVFATDERERFTILDAPELGDGRPRAARVQHREQGGARRALPDLHAVGRHVPAAPRARGVPGLQRLDAATTTAPARAAD